MKEYIIERIGKEKYEEYLSFAFEYGYQEASFLQIKDIKSIAKLCKFRTRVLLNELEEALIELEEEEIDPKKLNLLIYKDRISALIHKRYYPK